MQKPVRRVRAASDYCRPSNGQSVFVAHSRLAALTSQAPEGERGHDTISGRRAQAWTGEKNAVPISAHDDGTRGRDGANKQRDRHKQTASIPASGTRRRCRGARSRGRRRGRGTGRQADRQARGDGRGTGGRGGRGRRKIAQGRKFHR